VHITCEKSKKSTKLRRKLTKTSSKSRFSLAWIQPDEYKWLWNKIVRSVWTDGYLESSNQGRRAAAAIFGCWIFFIRRYFFSKKCLHSFLSPAGCSAAPAAHLWATPCASPSRPPSPEHLRPRQFLRGEADETQNILLRSGDVSSLGLMRSQKGSSSPGLYSFLASHWTSIGKQKFGIFSIDLKMRGSKFPQLKN